MDQVCGVPPLSSYYPFSLEYLLLGIRKPRETYRLMKFLRRVINNWFNFALHRRVFTALYTQCFPSVCGKNFTGDSGGIRTHDLLPTSADVLTSRPPSLPDDDRPVRILCGSGFCDIYRSSRLWSYFSTDTWKALSTQLVKGKLNQKLVGYHCPPIVSVRGRGVEGSRGRGVEGSRGRGVEGSRGRGVEGSRGRGVGSRGRGVEGSRGRGVEGSRGRGVEGSRGRGEHTQSLTRARNAEVIIT